MITSGEWSFNSKCSVSKLTYKGLQKPDASPAERLGNAYVGDQEPSGAVLNTQGVVSAPESGAAARFRTEYKLRYASVWYEYVYCVLLRMRATELLYANQFAIDCRFLDTTPVGLEREGHVRGGTLPPVGDAFERSTALHEKRLAEQPFSAPRVAAALDSYQSRWAPQCWK